MCASREALQASPEGEGEASEDSALVDTGKSVSNQPEIVYVHFSPPAPPPHRRSFDMHRQTVQRICAK